MIMLERFVTAAELEEIGKENDVTLYNRECICDVLGKRLYKFNVFNKKSNCYINGEKTLFGTGKKEFRFIDKSCDLKFEQILLFEDNEEKINKTLKLLHDKDYKFTFRKLSKMSVSLNILLDKTSIFSAIGEAGVIGYIPHNSLNL